jgi:hypothetical protein
MVETGESKLHAGEEMSEAFGRISKCWGEKSTENLHHSKANSAKSTTSVRNWRIA